MILEVMQGFEDIAKDQNFVLLLDHSQLAGIVFPLK